jgi:hypothetical protein
LNHNEGISLLTASGAAADNGFIGGADTDFIELAFALEHEETQLCLINVGRYRGATVLLEVMSWCVGD